MRVPLKKIIRQLPATSPLHQIKHRLDIRKHLRQGKKALHDTRVHDREHRNQYLEHKSLQYRILDQKKLARKVQSMHKAELMPYIYIYIKIRAFLNPKTFQALNFVEIQTSEGTERITDRDELKNTLLQHHRTHFTQAQHTSLS